MANQVVENCGFHHIALSASDFEKSLKFYTEGLGFTVYRSWIAGSGKKIALLDMGNGNCIELFSDGEKAEYPAEPAGSYFHLALNTTDAKSAYEKAIAYGAPSHKAPAEYTLPAQPPIEAVIAFVKGPDGELIEFFQQMN
ncbi:MAG: VOC family protein [Clostridia bacterium]|nr:VOC family protein [Clostridia bacterium]